MIGDFTAGFESGSFVPQNFEDASDTREPHCSSKIPRGSVVRWSACLVSGTKTRRTKPEYSMLPSIFHLVWRGIKNLEQSLKMEIRFHQARRKRIESRSFRRSLLRGRMPKRQPCDEEYLKRLQMISWTLDRHLPSSQLACCILACTTF